MLAEVQPKVGVESLQHSTKTTTPQVASTTAPDEIQPNAQDPPHPDMLNDETPPTASTIVGQDEPAVSHATAASTTHLIGGQIGAQNTQLTARTGVFDEHACTLFYTNPLKKLLDRASKRTSQLFVAKPSSSK